MHHRHTQRLSTTLVAVWCAWWCWSADALAHFGQPQTGRFPFRDASGEFIGGGTTWGLVAPVEDHFERVCEEAIGPVAYFFHPSSRGVLIGAIDGLLLTDDDGCSYAPTGGESLVGQSVTALSAVDGALLTATGTAGAANGLWRSTDDGATFSPLLAPIDDVAFFRLVASADGQVLVASGSDARTAPPVRPAVFVSLDGGQSFTDHSAAFAAFDLVSALTFTDDETAVLFGGFDIEGGIAVRFGVDGLAVPTLVGRTPAEIRDMAVFQDAIYAVVPLRKELYRLSTSDADFVRVAGVEDGPTACIKTAPDGSELIGCGEDVFLGLGAFMTSTDGVTWTTRLRFSDIDYRVCDTSTVGYTACAARYESNCDNGADEDNDGLFDCDDLDCARRCQQTPAEGEGEAPGEPSNNVATREAATSCASSSGAVASLALLALWSGVRRRHPRPA